MTDNVTHHIARLEAADGAEITGMFKSLIRNKELSSVMKQINADLRAGDQGQRARAASVLQKLGFPLDI